MGFFSWIFPSNDSTRIRERVMFTQKQRINALERDLERSKRTLESKEDELNRTRDNHETKKERLVEQIIRLSDKFADLNQEMLNIAHDNTKLRALIETRKWRKRKK